MEKHATKHSSPVFIFCNLLNFQRVPLSFTCLSYSLIKLSPVLCILGSGLTVFEDISGREEWLAPHVQSMSLRTKFGNNRVMLWRRTNQMVLVSMSRGLRPRLSTSCKRMCLSSEWFLRLLAYYTLGCSHPPFLA